MYLIWVVYGIYKEVGFISERLNLQQQECDLLCSLGDA